MKNNSVSLVIPCYNEEDNIKSGVLDKIGTYSQTDARIKEVLIVDDGSSDTSKKQIKERFLKKYPKLHLIENLHSGKAFAILTGIKNASAEYIFFSDFDLATPLEESEKLYKKIDAGYPVVIGSRSTNRKGAPMLRKIMAVGFIISRNIIIGIQGVTDTQCGFKIFRRDVALEIAEKLRVFRQEKVIAAPSVTAGFDIELLFIAKKLGCRIAEVPVTWHHVESKRVTFLRDALETYRDIFKIRIHELLRNYDFSKKKYLVKVL